QLEGILMRLKETTDRFFKFEIEEDELKSVLDASFKGLKVNCPTTPIYNKSVLSNASFSRTMTTSNKAPEVAFRVRGKTSNDIDTTWQTDTPSKRSEEDEIKAAEKAMKKQAKIQAWLVEKERREMFKLQQQEDYIEEQRKLQAEKDAKFYKRAQETKKKLTH
ncbi:kinesin, partial [Thraustotheca clavata]